MAPYLLLRSLIELRLRGKVVDWNDLLAELLADVLPDAVQLTKNRTVVTADIVKYFDVFDREVSSKFHARSEIETHSMNVDIEAKNNRWLTICELSRILNLFVKLGVFPGVRIREFRFAGCILLRTRSFLATASSSGGSGCGSARHVTRCNCE